MKSTFKILLLPLALLVLFTRCEKEEPNVKITDNNFLNALIEQGIDTNAYYLKLCGSGGGGYILGFTPDYVKAQEILKNYKLELVYKF